MRHEWSGSESCKSDASLNWVTKLSSSLLFNVEPTCMLGLIRGSKWSPLTCKQTKKKQGNIWEKHDYIILYNIRVPVSCTFVIRLKSRLAWELIYITELLRLSITCTLQNSKLNWQMRVSLPSIKCLVAPPSFQLLLSAR